MDVQKGEPKLILIALLVVGSKIILTGELILSRKNAKMPLVKKFTVRQKRGFANHNVRFYA